MLDTVLAAAATRPESVAVTGPEGSLTYAELQAWSDRVASGLLDAGIGPGDVVGVSVPRDHFLPAALLAVWRAGAAYLPLDADYPAERLAQLAADGGARVVLVRGPVPPALPTSLDADELAAQAVPRALPGARPEGLAYVLYTSGSSGRPKGVEVTHANLAAFVAGFVVTPGIGPADSMAAVAPSPSTSRSKRSGRRWRSGAAASSSNGPARRTGTPWPSGSPPAASPCCT